LAKKRKKLEELARRNSLLRTFRAHSEIKSKNATDRKEAYFGGEGEGCGGYMKKLPHATALLGKGRKWGA